ncbi:L-alanine-DL-glutamate epimerase [Streptomyces venezuelae]|uniref:L-alanine-DL-glutamate epimerase n=1 Tax=Streptomyces venezuelae TaxID=54571 RepID=A0A5P2BQK1_STRVZ|nr:GNAT family N-acetyltransferase [Streptomyces venezuelae]QES32447.1 L-alanine-DL-glutamate epimerase [Streptomyces venezuelae]
MRVTAHETSLTQRHLWRSAREAIPVTRTVIVEAEQDGVSGYGEASCFMTDHYNSGLERMHADLRRTAPLLTTLDVCGPDGDADIVWQRLAAELPDSPFVLAALDSALHDLRARLLGVPLWKSLGLDRPHDLRSSYSIGLDTPEAMAGKLRERPGWCAYKVKLADPGDLGILRELRRQTDAPFLIDGNCGWGPGRLVPALPQLHDLGVRLIEQPYPRAAWDDARSLKEISPIPVIADESITSPADLDACADAFHGINVKPMKAGGLTPALAMLRAARERGLITMLGCMPESAAGVTATAHLGGLVDHLDVDVVDLLAVDTGQGLGLDATGHVALPDRPGSGYLPDATAHGWYVHHVPAERAHLVRRQVPGCAPAMPGAGHPRDEHPQDAHPATRHLAVLLQGREAGAVSLYAEDPPAGHDLPNPRPGRARRLHGMATLGEVRGTGAGSALLRTALTVAALDGAETVWGHVPDAALGFYRKHRFDVLGRPLDLPGAGPHHFVHRSTR